MEPLRGWGPPPWSPAPKADALSLVSLLSLPVCPAAPQRPYSCPWVYPLPHPCPRCPCPALVPQLPGSPRLTQPSVTHSPWPWGRGADTQESHTHQQQNSSWWASSPKPHSGDESEPPAQGEGASGARLFLDA